MAKKAKIHTEKIESSNIIKANFFGERVLCDETQESRQLYDLSRFGEIKEGKIQYSLARSPPVFDPFST